MGNLLRPKTTWKNNEHYLKLLDDPWYKTIALIENIISLYTSQFYEKKSIYTLHLPITTGTISSPMGLGSDSQPVKIDLFGVKTYLADSMQFMLEYACRLFENGAYYIMPSFRGEKADKRHLCQFYHSEAEIPGCLEDIIQLVEEYIKFLSNKILENIPDQIEQIAGTTRHIENIIELCGNIPQIEFDEAAKILKNNPKYIRQNEGYRNITNAGEKEILKIVGKEAVWITKYDYISVPFYQKFCNNKSKALNADLLMGIGETVGAGERHYDIKELNESLKIHNVNIEDYEWYCKMKEKYPMQTSGFGMGIERFILWLLKYDDIRNCQILPRFNEENCIP